MENNQGLHVENSPQAVSNESVLNLFEYWLPEVISLTLLIVLPIFLNNYFMAELKSNAVFGTLGIATRAIHWLMKFAESIPVASIALIGRHNGVGQTSECGKRLSDALWTTGIIGISLGVMVFLGAESIYRFLGVPETMIPIGLTFLRIQAITIPFMFLFQTFMGFFKGVKNTQIPLFINIITITLFVISDYLLIFGFWKIPALWLTGSALASLIQYVAATIIAAIIIKFSKQYKPHTNNTIIHPINPSNVIRLLKLSIPVVIDKGMLALAVLWLGKMIAFGGEDTLSSSEILRNIERWALVCGLAFAQVVTFVVSNNIGAHNPEGAKKNLSKVMFISILLTLVAMIFINLNLDLFTTRQDPNHTLDIFIKPTAYLLTLFLAIDVIQIIFAAALRGAGDVQRVMWVRSVACLGFFGPTTYIISLIPGVPMDVKFVTMYTLYYATTAIMAILFYLRIRGTSWLAQKI